MNTPFLTEVAQQIPPNPDNYFWYAISGVLAAITCFFVIKWLNGVENWKDKSEKLHQESAKRFEIILSEIRDLRQAHAVQDEIIKGHAKAIENVSNESSANAKLANEMALMLQFLNSGNDNDENNPTVRRFRKSNQ